MKIKDSFSLRTVRKKIIMVSKAAGIILIISYVISTGLPIEQDFSFLQLLQGGTLCQSDFRSLLVSPGIQQRI